MIEKNIDYLVLEISNAVLYLDCISRARLALGNDIGDDCGFDSNLVNNINRKSAYKLHNLDADNATATGTFEYTSDPTSVEAALCPPVEKQL